MSTNLSGWVETRLLSKISYLSSSRSWARRVRASIRKCLSHFGQTFRFSSRSFFQMIWRHSSHLTHRPSVLTFFSPEVSSSPDWRLNQVIHQYPVPSTQYPVPRTHGFSGYRVLGTGY